MSTKRVEASVSPQKLAAMRQLRDRDVYVSLFFLVGLPYLESKATDYWERIGGGVLAEDEDDLFGDEGDEAPARAVATRVHQETVWQRRKREWESFVRRAYPYAQVGYQVWMLAYHIGYLFGRTPYWRPWLRAMRVDVRRAMGNEEPLREAGVAQALPSFSQYPLLFAYVLARRGGSRVLDALKYALPASIFFFKFLEWWYSPNNRRRRGDDSDDARKRIGPPALLPPSAKGVVYDPPASYKAPPVLSKVNVPLDTKEDVFADEGAPATLLHNSCPLCGATPMHNPCVLATGYAFCFTCATEYVDKWHRCPVTMAPLPAGVEQIRRVLV